MEWYRGARLTNMAAVYEVWIKKTHKETWSPMLYDSVLVMFWTIPRVLEPQSPVKVHMLGPRKLLLSVNETGNFMLKVKYRELVAAIGVVFKDLETGQFLDRDILSKPVVPSTWKKELVSTVYILDFLDDGPPHPHARAHSTWVTDPNSPPSGRAVGEGERLTSDAPHNGGRHPPRGRPSATPTASNAGPQGRTLWGRCWVPTPAPMTPGTHGSRNPGRPPQKTGGRGRDSA